MSSNSSESSTAIGAASPPAVPSAPVPDVTLAALEPEPLGTSAALREDQIQNAVAFLTHPKVRDSPASTKRSFLERKGLTAAEIDEAFKRVPEQPAAAAAPSITLTQPATTSTGLITYQQQQPAQTQQQGAIVPVAHAPQQYQYQPAGPVVQQQAQRQPEPVRWSQVLLGVGVVAAGVYAVKSLLYPYAHDWYTSWVDKSRAQREAQERQAAALQEAAEALKAVQAELRTSSEAMSSLVASIKEQHKQQATAMQASELSSMRRSDQLLQELRELRNTVALQASPASAFTGHAGRSPQQAAPAGPTTMGSLYGEDRAHRPPEASSSYYGTTTTYTNYNGTSNGNSVPWQQPISSSASAPPYPGGSDTIAPPPKGYLGGHSGSPASQQGTVVDGSEQQAAARRSQPPPPAGDVPYPTSFHEVMEMVSKGITPPNVRKDIKDTPPDPTRPLPDAVAKPASKPWERAGSSKSASSFPPVASSSSMSRGDDFAVQPAFDPSAGFGGGWGMPPGAAAGGSPGSSSSQGAQPPGTTGPGGSSSEGPVYSSIFGGMQRQSSPPPQQGPPPPAAAFQPPSYPPVSVLQGTLNTAWKPPAVPMPTVLRHHVASASGSGGSSSRPDATVASNSGSSEPAASAPGQGSTAPDSRAQGNEGTMVTAPEERDNASAAFVPEIAPASVQDMAPVAGPVPEQQAGGVEPAAAA